MSIRDKKFAWFSLVEMMVVIGIIGIIYIGVMQYMKPQQMKSRDQIRITKMGRFESAIEQFRQEFYAYPIASSFGSASDFSEASGVTPEEAGEYVNNSAVCSNRSDTNAKSAQTNKLFHWFGKYLAEGGKSSVAELKQDTAGFKLYMDKVGGPVEGIDTRDWIVYKWVFKNWQFLYQFAIPLELGSADARNDGGKLGDRFFEKGDLIGTDDAISDNDIGCMKIEGKLPFDIKVPSGASS